MSAPRRFVDDDGSPNPTPECHQSTRVHTSCVHKAAGITGAETVTRSPQGTPTSAPHQTENQNRLDSSTEQKSVMDTHVAEMIPLLAECEDVITSFSSAVAEFQTIKEGVSAEEYAIVKGKLDFENARLQKMKEKFMRMQEWLSKKAQELGGTANSTAQINQQFGNAYSETQNVLMALTLNLTTYANASAGIVLGTAGNGGQEESDDEADALGRSAKRARHD